MVLQVKVGHFVNNITNGTQNITGVGFQPKAVILFWIGTVLNDFQANVSLGIGFASSTSSANQKSYFIQSFDAEAPSDVDSSWQSDAVWHEQLFPNVGFRGRITTFGSDGFTITWSNAGGNIASFIVNYIAIGGDDLTNVFAGQFNAPSSTGNHAVTGIGFQPDCVILLGTNFTADDVLTDDFGTYCLGFGNSDLEMGVAACITENGVATMDTARYQRTNKILAMFATADATTLTHEATLVSMDSDGFTLNYTVASIANKRVAYIALKGGKYKIGSFTAPTSGSTPVSQSITSVGFQPKGAMFLSDGNPASTSIQNHHRLSIGAANSASDERCIWGADEDGADSAITATRSDDNTCIRVSDEAVSSDSSTTQALANLTSLNSNGFTLSWSVRDTGNAYQILYLAFGDSGTLFTRSVNETVSVDDALAIHRNINRSLSVTTAINDAVAKKLTAFRTVGTQSLTVNDAVTRIKSVSRSVVESFTVADAVARFYHATRSVSESITVADAVTRLFSVGRNIADSLTVTDALDAARLFVGSVSESLTINDAVARLYSGVRTVTESLTVADAVVRTIVQQRFVIGSLAITDLVGTGKDILRSVAESFTVATTGVGSRLTEHFRSIFESLAVSQDGFAEVCKTAGQLKEIIIHKLGRFFSVLPQRNIRAYTFDSDIIKQKEKETLG